MNSKVNKLIGANMDIDFSNPAFGNTKCPWNQHENTHEHKCAVKDISICRFFCGIQYLDTVLCSYPNENTTAIKLDEID